MTEYSIPFDQNLVFEYEMDLESCKALTAQLIQIPELTAVVTTADIMAAGVMTGLRDAGVRVPDDLSIVGFDDLNISQMLTPPLTTIHQDMMEKGRLAVNFMIQKLEGKTLSQTEIALPIHLVERQSVKSLL